LVSCGARFIYARDVRDIPVFLAANIIFDAHFVAVRVNEAGLPILSIILWINDFPKGGGVPVMIDGQIAGAVGVGGPDLQDECAQAGIDAILSP
jgi:uncharacterized protein GlcG (DUF336 family)